MKTSEWQLKKKIFLSFGEVKVCRVNYNLVGESLGSADVHYVNAEDAKKAVQEVQRSLISRVDS